MICFARKEYEKRITRVIENNTYTINELNKNINIEIFYKIYKD